MRQEYKYLAIKELNLAKGYPIGLLCEVIELNRSSYYKWLHREITHSELENENLIGRIRILENRYHGILGYRRMTMYLNRGQEKYYNHKRIYRLMCIIGLKSVIRKKRPSYVRSTPQITAENILNREFTAAYFNEKWLADVTEFKYGSSQKAYLSAILDIKDRRIVSYVIGHSNSNQLVFGTFNLAIEHNPTAKPLFHSDRGFQYTNKIFKTMLDKAEMNQSMSRVGCCIDNGPMEGFWGILKSEMYYLNHFKTYENLKAAIEQYIYFYNYQRLQANLCNLAPCEYHDHLLNSVAT